MEVFGEAFVKEELFSRSHVELSVGDTSIPKEVDGEDGFGVSGEESRGSEVEGGVGSQGLGDAFVAQLVGCWKVVEASSIRVAVIDELWNESQPTIPEERQGRNSPDSTTSCSSYDCHRSRNRHESCWYRLRKKMSSMVDTRFRATYLRILHECSSHQQWPVWEDQCQYESSSLQCSTSS